jgi:TorA maturation chaperone TorD
MDEPAMSANSDADRASAPEERIAPEPTTEETLGDPDDEPEYHAARATLYGLLGGAFVYPEAEVLADLTAEEARAGVEQAAERLGFGAEAAELLDALDATDAESLAAAYNELFGLPDGGEYPVVPYEGHYTTGSEVSEEQRRIATVVGLMEQFGVTPSDDFAERQDHVAAELELMQVVAAQRSVAAHEGKDEAADNLGGAEATILDEHLVGFVPAFAHELRRATDNDVYLAAATLAERLVSEDHAAHDTTDAAEGVSDRG